MPDPFEVFLVLLLAKAYGAIHSFEPSYEIFDVKIYRETIYFHVSNVVCNSDLTTLTTYAHFSVQNVIAVTNQMN